MSDVAVEPRKKHRHDLGQEDHGSVMAAGTTRAIQVLLGMWILGTFVLTIYVLASATGPSGSKSTGSKPSTMSRPH